MTPQASTEPDKPSPPERIWLLLALALAIRLIYWLQAADNPLLSVALVDEGYYLDQARQVLAGGWTWAEGFIMDPLYTWFLAGALAIGDGVDPFWARLLQVGIDSLNVIALWLIGRRLWSDRVGLVAGALYALYPVAWLYSLSLLKATLTTSAVLWLTWLVVWVLMGRRGLLWWLVVGLAIGLVTYLRGNLLLLAPLIVLALALLLRPWRHALAAVGLLVLGTGIVLTSVATAHRHAGGPWAPLPAVAGYTLYSANHPNNPRGVYRTPAFVNVDAPAELLGQFQQEAARRRGLPADQVPDPWATSAYWRGQAMRWWISSPSVLPRLLWYKLNQLITGAEIPNVHNIRLHARYAPMLVPWLPVFAIALALGLPGLIIGIRRQREALVLLAPIAMVAATTVIYYGASRLRLPMVPMLLLGIGVLADGDWHRRWRSALAVGAAASLLLLASLLAWHPGIPMAQALLQAARAHAQLGQLDAADRLLEAAGPAMIDNTRALITRSAIALMRGDYAASRRLGEHGLRIDPDSVELLFNTGVAALRQGDVARAFELLRRADAISPDEQTCVQLELARQALDDR